MFSCRACGAHEKNIKNLEEQISYLRTLIFPKQDMYNPPLIHREADAVMSATTELLDIPPEQKEEAKSLDPNAPGEADIEERDKILSGNY